MADNKTELVSLRERSSVIAAFARVRGGTTVSARAKGFFADRLDAVLVPLHILRIVGSLAWRKEIARRRLLGWARAFAGGWFSHRLTRIAPDSGFCFRAPAPRKAVSDQEGLSMLILIEDDASLVGPHSAHKDIRCLGCGRYSHWGRHIYFSSSDNSDPRQNGRVYKLVRRI